MENQEREKEEKKKSCSVKVALDENFNSFNKGIRVLKSFKQLQIEYDLGMLKIAYNHKHFCVTKGEKEQTTEEFFSLLYSGNALYIQTM